MTAIQQFNRVIPGKHGEYICNVNDPIVGRSLELYGEYCEQATAVLDQVLQPGWLAIDVGANIGVHAVFMARKVGPSGRLLAFEPQRLLFQALCGNMALNSVTNAHCWNMAVGAETGEITVPEFNVHHPDQIAGVRPGEHHNGESVPLVTIDSLRLPRCDFIKIGCEAMESEIIAGARQTIVRNKPVLYIEFNHTVADRALLKQIDSIGYAMFWHETQMYSAVNHNRNQQNVFGPKGARNILCIDKAADRQLTGFTEVEISHAA